MKELIETKDNEEAVDILATVKVTAHLTGKEIDSEVHHAISNSPLPAKTKIRRRNSQDCRIDRDVSRKSPEVLAFVRGEDRRLKDEVGNVVSCQDRHNEI